MADSYDSIDGDELPSQAFHVLLKKTTAREKVQNLCSHSAHHRERVSALLETHLF